VRTPGPPFLSLRVRHDSRRGRARNQTLFGWARHNRQTLNDAEARIWSELRRRELGVRVRRQHPIGPYILDFACIALKLAVELDGSQHLRLRRTHSPLARPKGRAVPPQGG
jgi:very-short-patch-repair endonuclease